MLLHLGAAHLATERQTNTVWARLTARSRLLCVLLLVFAIALTPNGRWWTWATYGGAIALLILVSRVPCLPLLKRVAVELIFVGVVLIGTLFRQGGDVLFHWGWIQITTEGVTVLGSVTLKAFLSLLTVNILILTTPITALLHALAELKTPPLLVAIFSSMYRYIYVLIDEFNSMQRAARSRNLMSDPRRQRTVIGNMIGSLFIRTYERGDRVHQAMLARGYSGLPPLADLTKSSSLDVAALTFTAVILLIGQAIYL
ncbi:cobalt ECF transporter T component CbiQ [Myxacorys almedinensis]|uniref:Cobalt ECF transporter T component CbiQ n=1 Tax=Myxacorys almedinensis A TaxID=2690445 RepID=A0A8J7YY70_9CYAN|nr:cobalt ECF transporter T component CbiQ [Myxacorys almedinensis]NDJ16724.1 cobalt ECF transporter T component CbiQ [Myxacorys almedinensis A]